MNPSSGTIRILHVDDEPDLADLTATYLKRKNERFTIEIATSVDEGLDRLRNDEFDCIISDYEMPGQNGIDFLEIVRKKYSDLPFVLYTGKGSEEVASDAISAGVTDYLQKGTDTSKYTVLANRVRNAVEKYRVQQQLADRQQHLDLFFEQSPLGVIEWDTDFTISRANTTATDILGYSKKDLIGQPWETIVPESDRDDVASVVSNRLKNEGGQHSINKNVRGDGDQVTCEWHNRVVTDEDGEIVTIFSQFQDITKRIAQKQELKDEQQFIEQSLNALDSLFYVIDTNGTIRRWNDRVLEVMGYTESELEGMYATEVFPEDQQERIADAISQTLSDGYATVEADIQTADADRLPYEWTGARLTDDNGDTTGLVGIGRDLTERRRRERRFQALVESSNDIISVVDADGTFQYQSPSSERILGYDSETMVGDTVWEYIHPEDRERVVTQFEEWIENPTETADLIEYRAEHADGSWRWMESHANDQTDNPTVSGYVINSRDITKKKQREQQLKDERERYTTLFETLPTPVLHATPADGEPVVQRVNPAFEDVFECDAESIRGDRVHEYIVPEDRTTDAEQLNQRIMTEGEVQTDVQRKTTDGKRIFQLNVQTRGTQSGGIDGYAVYTDITEREEYERELEAQNEQLEEFTSIVSHDLRNPLSVAAGSVELAQESCESDHLDRVANAIDRSQALIEDLLRLARTDEQVTEVEPVTLAEIATQSWRTVETRSATLETETNQTLRADGGQLQQLVENLIRNAIEHGGDDVTVTVGNLENGFYIEDDGAGVDTEEQGDIFEAGYSTSEEGTGFGLAIVKRVVQAHGWTIRVTGGSNGGARFEITGVEFGA